MYKKVEKRQRSAKHCGEVLLIGVEGAGKTLLCRHIDKISKGSSAPLQAATQPSIGVEKLEVQHHSRFFTVREVGGIMQPVWHRYFEACAAVILVADASSIEGAAGAAVELSNLLRTEALGQKPVLLLINKRDTRSAPPELSIRMLMGLPALERAAGARLCVVPGSALTGDGLTKVLDWCVVSCQAHQEMMDAVAAAAKAKAAKAAKAEAGGKSKSWGFGKLRKRNVDRKDGMVDDSTTPMPTK